MAKYFYSKMCKESPQVLINIAEKFFEIEHSMPFCSADADDEIKVTNYLGCNGCRVVKIDSFKYILLEDRRPPFLYEAQGVADQRCVDRKAKDLWEDTGLNEKILRNLPKFLALDVDVLDQEMFDEFLKGLR